MFAHLISKMICLCQKRFSKNLKPKSAKNPSQKDWSHDWNSIKIFNKVRPLLPSENMHHNKVTKIVKLVYCIPSNGPAESAEQAGATFFVTKVSRVRPNWATYIIWSAIPFNIYCEGEGEVAFFSAKRWDRRKRADLIESATPCHDAHVVGPYRDSNPLRLTILIFIFIHSFHFILNYLSTVTPSI